MIFTIARRFIKAYLSRVSPLSELKNFSFPVLLLVQPLTFPFSNKKQDNIFFFTLQFSFGSLYTLPVNNKTTFLLSQKTHTRKWFRIFHTMYSRWIEMNKGTNAPRHTVKICLTSASLALSVMLPTNTVIAVADEFPWFWFCNKSNLEKLGK